MDPHTKQYDFIVIGGGPAGITFAARLARSAKAPEVLLVEAGGPNDDISKRIVGERFQTWLSPGMNWGYQTTPQKHLRGRRIDASRGKGLGGGSSINFVVYTVGPKDDYERWARIVADDAYGWENARRVFNNIETYELHVDEANRKYANPRPEHHGTTGPIHVSLPKKWERGFQDLFDAAEQSGMGINVDANSGDPLGIGPHVNSAHGSLRSTATAYLKDAPSNLTIITNTFVEQVMFDGNIATGIQTKNGTYLASKEVIVSAGAINSPKLLMLSGIGPNEHLKSHGISCIQDLPIGKNLQDHPNLMFNLLRKPETSDRAAFRANEQAVAEWRRKWAEDPISDASQLSVIYNCLGIGFFQNPDLYKTQTFLDLSKDLQHDLQAPTIPHWEFVSGMPAPPPNEGKILQPEDAYLAAIIIGMSTQSRGQVTLASSNPDDPPLIDLNIFDSEFDRFAMIANTRAFLRFMNHPTIAKDSLGWVTGPNGDTDEEIWDYIQRSAGSGWHHSCTVMMGPCVDVDFKVHGVKNLRVVDTSVCPFVLNCHIQSVAYLLGEIAAEKTIEEYQLDRK